MDASLSASRAAVPELDLDLDLGRLCTGAVLRLLQQFHRPFMDDFLVLEVRGYPAVIHGMNGDDRQLVVRRALERPRQGGLASRRPVHTDDDWLGDWDPDLSPKGRVHLLCVV